MGPHGSDADRLADLEQKLQALERYTATQHRPQAPMPGIVVRNAISTMPPDAEEGDDYQPTDRPWIIFTDAPVGTDPEAKRREKAAIRAQTRDGSQIIRQDQKLVVYYYSGRWWIVPDQTVEVVYLGDPDSSDAYVEPNEDADAYDARLFTLDSPLTGEPSETKVWLLVGQRYDEHLNVKPLPRGLVLLASLRGKVTTGAEEETRPLYYADHWQWLWVKLNGETKVLDSDAGRDREAVVLDKDGEETEITLTAHNHSGVAIPAGSKVFVDYHAESGQWWIRQPPAGTIVRAKVLDATITTDGDVNLYDDNALDWSADATEIINRGRPLFADEVITVGLNRSGEWTPLEVPQHLFTGTADAVIAKGATGNVTLDLGTTPTISAASPLGAIAEGDKVVVAWNGTGWIILAAECPEEA